MLDKSQFGYEEKEVLAIRFERLKSLRGFITKMEMHYYRNKNADMCFVMAERMAKVVYEIEKLSIALKPLNALALAEYQKSDVHQFLMNSKGKNGRDILISLNKKDIFTLSSPTLYS